MICLLIVEDHRLEGVVEAHVACGQEGVEKGAVRAWLRRDEMEEMGHCADGLRNTLLGDLEIFLQNGSL